MKYFAKAVKAKKKLPLLTYGKSSPGLERKNIKKVFSLVHKYETFSRMNSSTSSFKATKWRLGTVLNL